MADPNKFYEEISEEHLKGFRFIGRGSFGEIFRARHQDWGIDVAIKFLSRNSSFTRKELLNEARAMEKARFNYILRLFGLFTSQLQADANLASAGEPSLGLVMEYMENGNLSTLIYQIPSVPWALRFRILHEVALGMNFLHNLSPPLLHLDLKPSNVLLDGELHVRVSDFGLSKFKKGTAQQCNPSSEEEDACGGTLEFMPPEAFDLSYRPAPSTDVYSYGILMWSVLNSQEPYHNLQHSNMSSLIRMHIPKGQRPSMQTLEKLVAQVPKLENLINLMRRCWDNEKGQRPSFRDCSKEMEEVRFCYEEEIRPAVRKVQDILMQKGNSPMKTTTLLEYRSSMGVSPSPVTPEDHQLLPSWDDLEERFSTFHLGEPLSRQNEAVNPEALFKKKSYGLQRSCSMSNSKENMRTEYKNIQPSEDRTQSRTRQKGVKQRPLSDIYPFPTFPTYPPGYPPYQQLPKMHNQQPLYGLQGDGSAQLDHSAQARPTPAATYGAVHISGHIEGVQVGGGNYMHIDQLSSIKSWKK